MKCIVILLKMAESVIESVDVFDEVGEMGKLRVQPGLYRFCVFYCNLYTTSGSTFEQEVTSMHLYFYSSHVAWTFQRLTA